ncbi:MAG: DNA repair protein RecN [Acidimicrobiales bacterium]
MLTELRVRQLGVVRDLTIELEAGMTVLTGETGAGKTLLVEALQLVTGGRGSPQLVRADAEEALVEARFEVTAPDPAAGPGAGPTERMLARSVPVSGRSKAWVDGRMTPVAVLTEVGASLVDIHGQHEHQSLVTTAAQRRELDGFAGIDLGPLATARRILVGIERRLADLGGDEHQRARQADVLRHQVTEIEAARLADPSEEAELAAEEARLSDLSAHREAAARAVAALAGDDGGPRPSAARLLGDAVTALAGREPLAPWEARLRSVATEAADVASDLRDAAETWEDDPARLAEVQARRRILADLRHKYGPTLDDVVRFAVEGREALESVERATAAAAALEAERSEASVAVERAEEVVRRARLRSAPLLAHAVAKRLADLAMPDARVEVTVGDAGPGDAVGFLLAANPGEPPLPLSRVASGGELARAMLALRLVVGGGAPTALFDEVDAGVGGSAAVALARALREVALTRQVLVVTHLAQVAAFADHQIAVRKVVEGDGRTVTTAARLGPDQRVVELSRMLSGRPESRTARAHAEELLVTAASSRKTRPASHRDPPCATVAGGPRSTTAPRSSE